MLFNLHDILEAPCCFCGYNGMGYYQAHTHGKECPWYEIGSNNEREHALVVFAKKGWLKIVPQPAFSVHVCPDCGEIIDYSLGSNGCPCLVHKWWSNFPME